MNRLFILGGGAWGTALAQTLARAGREIVLWAREAETVAAINSAHENPVFLPGVALDPGLRATSDLAEAARADAVLLSVPAQYVRAVTAGLALAPAAPVVICTKGIEVEDRRAHERSAARDLARRARGRAVGPDLRA